MTDLESLLHEDLKKVLLLYGVNILTDDSGSFFTEHNYFEDEDGSVRWKYPVEQWAKKDCAFCKHGYVNSEGEITCSIIGYKSKNLVCLCEAEEPIEELNIIGSKEEMIQFIASVQSMFRDNEYYADFFGVQFRQDEETGEYIDDLESVNMREYLKQVPIYDIPKEYPCVIYFDPYNLKKLKWIKL